jgi:ribosomal protein S13
MPEQGEVSSWRAVRHRLTLPEVFGKKTKETSSSVVVNDYL